MKKYSCFICLILIFATGCQKYPATSDTLKHLSADVAEKSSSLIKVESFSKTDAQKFEMMGIEGYKVEFTAKLAFQQEALRIRGLFGGGPPYAARPPTPASEIAKRNQERQANIDRGVPLFYIAPIYKEDTTPAGTTINVKGQIIYEKKESGWSVAQIETREVR